MSLEVGYDVPATVGMTLEEVETPCLLLDLDALEDNLRQMAAFVADAGITLRPHGKMHKSADVAKLQAEIGGATGLCCQKVSEATAFVRAGITDVLVTNEVREAAKISRLARLASEAQVGVCVDDLTNVAELSVAASAFGVTLDCLVEVECGSRRCGVASPEAAVEVARAISEAPGLRFRGVQSYNGAMQHIADPAERRTTFDDSYAVTRVAVDALKAAGLPPQVVSGGGTGSYEYEAKSGLFTELQCGSYAFMDADYGRVRNAGGGRLDLQWGNALYVLASVMSAPTFGRAVCDAGHKSVAIDSGLPVPKDLPQVKYVSASDEHGTLDDPGGSLKVGDRVWLVPGHCDPTCNLHDWYVGVRGGVVETVWPVTARGKAW